MSKSDDEDWRAYLLENGASTEDRTGERRVRSWKDQWMMRLFASLLFWFSLGGLALLRLFDARDQAAQADLHAHPVASVLGTIFPATVGAVAIYWVLGIVLARKPRP